MSELLRPSHPPSYSPLPHNTHLDDDNDLGIETTSSRQGLGKSPFCPHWLQFAMMVVLLLLAGTSGFFVGLSFPQNRLPSSLLPDTVPQSPLSSEIPRKPPVDP